MPGKETLDLVYGVVMLVLTVGGVLMALLMLKLHKEFVTKADFETFCESTNSRIAGIGKKCNTLEENINTHPTAQDVKELTTALNNVDKQMAVLQNSLIGQRDLFERLEGKVDRMDVFIARGGR